MDPATAVVPILVCGYFLSRCQKWLRDPAKNPWPVRGLATVLLTWIFALVADILLPVVKSPVASLVALVALPAAAVAGLLLAGYGLIRGTPPGGNASRGSAASAMLLAAAFVAIFVPNALQARKASFPPGMMAPAQGRGQHVEAELNYSLVAPPEPWVVLDAGPLHVTQAFGDADAGLVASLVARKVGPGRFDSKGLAASMKDQLEQRGGRSTGISDAVLDGLPASQFRVVRANPKAGGNRVMAIRTLEMRGYIYTLQVVGPAEDQKAVGDALEAFCKRFAIIDREKTAAP